MNKPVKSYIFSLILLFLLNSPVVVFAESDIVEKNLFNPDREKWVMESPKEKKALKGKKGKVDDIVLSGTIVSDNVKSAVLAVSSKRKPGESSIFMVGDYMSGYLLKEIGEKSVVLQDVQSGEDYVVFLNDGKKSRSAVKTEIKNEARKLSADVASENEKSIRKKKKKRKKIITTPAETDSILKSRLNRSIDILQKKSSRLVLQQAENDYKKLRKLSPVMSASDKRELKKMRSKLDAIRLKDKKK